MSKIILRGKIQWIFYDEKGNETERVTLDADGWPRMLNVEREVAFAGVLNPWCRFVRK